MAFPLKLVTPPSSEPLSLSDAKIQLGRDPSFTDDDTLISDLIIAARQEIEDITGRAIMPQTWLLATDWFPVYRWWDSAPSRSDYDALGNYDFMGFRFNKTQTISIPRPPLIKINSITYVSPVDGSTQSIDISTLQVDAVSEPGRVLPAYGSFWPQVQPQANAVQLTFTAGYTQSTTGAVLNSGSGSTVQVGDPSTFYSLDSLARQDGATIGTYTVSSSGLATLSPADQGSNLIANFTSTAVPAWVRQALRLIVTAWYENRSDFLMGQTGGAPLPRGADAILMKHRSEIFGYARRG